jgi:dihydropteroate synthase
MANSQKNNPTAKMNQQSTTENVLKVGPYQLNLQEKTHIMGILNVTPDSFSDGGNFLIPDTALVRATQMIQEGADIIDIGGQATNPFIAQKVEPDEEIKRILPIIKGLVRMTNCPLSVDTYRASVAQEALAAGVHIINDIWGLQKDPQMASVIADAGAAVVLMRNSTTIHYPNDDIIKAIITFLEQSIAIAIDKGINKQSIIIDPGIGFGKTLEQNIKTMSHLNELKQLGYPILLGASRKSIIGKILQLPPNERLEGTLATTVMAILQKVDIVRVHDIKENRRAIKITDAIFQQKKIALNKNKQCPKHI